MKQQYRNKMNPGFLYVILTGYIFLTHVLFAYYTLNQISYEELAETVRNVFWLQNRLIYDGISTNIAWPAILLVIYNISGFSLHTAKYARLILELISLICLCILLRKTMGNKLAWLPLMTIGLSPTLLYFSTMQIQYGMDLLYLPISLYLLYSIDFKKPRKAFLIESLAWFVSMVGWMSYPSFIYYLPAIFIYYLSKLISNNPKGKRLWVVKNLSVSFISFLLPFLIILNFVNNRQIMIYDPVTKNGIFRGSGVFDFNSGVLLNNLNILSINLFKQSYGYYFDIKNVEFSSVYPILGIILSVLLCIKLFSSSKKLRLVIIFVLVTVISNILISGFTTTFYPGIRRFTPVVASIYVLFVLAWYYLNTQKYKNIGKKFLLTGLLLLIPFHHILVFPDNLANIQNPQWYKYMDVQWFANEKTPEKSLKSFLDQIQKRDITLTCLNNKGENSQCRYSEIYAAIAGSCFWNKLECHNISGYEEKTKKFIPLSIDLWSSYYFEH